VPLETQTLSNLLQTFYLREFPRDAVYSELYAAAEKLLMVGEFCMLTEKEQERNLRCGSLSRDEGELRPSD
jgi:hypothetical protein